MYRAALLTLALAIISTLAALLGSGTSLNYLVVRPSGSETVITVDLCSVLHIEVEQRSLPILYETALLEHGNSIKISAKMNVTLEQFSNGEIALVNYRAHYLLVDENGSLRELYYDEETGVLIYAVIVSDKRECEVILRTKLDGAVRCANGSSLPNAVPAQVEERESEGGKSADWNDWLARAALLSAPLLAVLAALYVYARRRHRESQLAT